MLFLQLWLAGSIGFVLGWIVHSALAKRRAEDLTSHVRTIDLEERPTSNPSRGRRVVSHIKHRDALPSHR